MNGKRADTGGRHRRLFSRRTTGGVIFDTLNILFLLLLAFTVVYPFWSTFLLSFSNTREALALGFHFWIGKWDLNGYRFILSSTNIGVAYLNSIFRTVVGTFLILACTLLAAYPLSDRRLPGRSAITIYFLIMLFFSGGLIPTYLLIRNIGLINTRWALILPLMVNAFYVVIMRNYLMTIDKAYQESALLDGANYFQILLRIIIPLAKPVIATIALWSAVEHWNAWFDAMIYIRSRSKIVLQLLLRQIVIQSEQNLADAMANFQSEVGLAKLPTQEVKAAITLLTIGPIVAVYPFLQRYFIKGVLVGSLKG